MTRPRIFVSAVSSELHSARQLVANALTSIGYEPRWQDTFPTEEGDVCDVLRRQIDSCKGVIQLVGQRYGLEPPQPDEQFRRVSFTQFEALYARTRRKKVWTILLLDDFPSDSAREKSPPEAPEVQRLQQAYRQRITTAPELYIPCHDESELKGEVLGLRKELDKLRRSMRLWMAWVTITLAMIAASTVVVMSQQGRTQEAIAELHGARLAEIDEARRKLQAALDRQHRTESAIVMIGMRATRSASTSPEVRSLADELERLIESFGADFDPGTLSEYDRERLEFAEAVRLNAGGRHDEALALVTAELAERYEHNAEAQAERACTANMIRGTAFYGKAEYRKSLEHFRRAERWV